MNQDWVIDRVVDGDTVDALVDLGFNTWKKVRIRLYRIDAWESRTRDAKEKIKGFAAKNRLIEILKNNDIYSIYKKGKIRKDRIDREFKTVVKDVMIYETKLFSIFEV